MSAAVYNVKAGIVNQSSSEFDRFAARILQVSDNTTEDFIKTYPFIPHPKNNAILSLIGRELPPYKKAAYIGISFFSYRYFNFIEITSTFKLFPLNQGDKMVFHLEGEYDPIELIFSYPKSNSGFATKNIHPLTDQQLALFSQSTLDHWHVINKEVDKSMVGGFTFNEVNRQYKSRRVGQQLFKLMSANILKAKKQLPR
jgi:hypothetical protein